MFSKDAIQEIAMAQAIGAATTALDSGIGDARHGVVVMPESFKVHDLEKMLSNRRRARGIMNTTTFAALAEYTKEHAEAGSAVFVNKDAMQAIAVLNLGTPTEPGHADNKAMLTLEKTAAYEALLLVASGQGQKQTTIAEFLEDWPAEIKCFNEAGPIEPPKAIAAIRKLTIESLTKLQNSVQSLSESKSAFEEVSATSADPIPTTIYFKCIPYVGLPEREFVLRLGVLTGHGVPMVNLRTVKKEQHQEEMANEFAGKVSEAIGTAYPVLLGTYSATA